MVIEKVTLAGLANFMSTSHTPESFGKRELQLKTPQDWPMGKPVGCFSDC